MKKMWEQQQRIRRHKNTRSRSTDERTQGTVVCFGMLRSTTNTFYDYRYRYLVHISPPGTCTGCVRVLYIRACIYIRSAFSLPTLNKVTPPTTHGVQIKISSGQQKDKMHHPLTLDRVISRIFLKRDLAQNDIILSQPRRDVCGVTTRTSQTPKAIPVYSSSSITRYLHGTSGSNTQYRAGNQNL